MNVKTIKSPCNDKCSSNNGYCTGCYRHIDEIVNWTTMSDKERKEVYKKIEKRRINNDR
jgi:predicted Fe-S protein YdhL (DUF1289 family)|tara:strand:+ start:676 stop:852 length:177 start_codon:yes stop_codon:yes gene_type:complete